MPERTRYGVSRRILPASVVFLVALGALYNGILAALNAAGVHQTYQSVALCEVAILALGAGYIAGAGVPILNRTAVVILVFGVGLTLQISLISGTSVLDCARAASVIGVFLMLGAAATESQIFGVFRLLSIVVVAFLILEIVDTVGYVRLLQPSLYYANTRGIEEAAYNTTGLFAPALGFQSRFSFGIASHRCASIFLEQVSLANFGGVLCVLLLGCFPRMSLLDRALHMATLVLIVLTTDSRATTVLTLLSLVGYVVFPLLPPRTTFAIMPGIIGVGFATILVLGKTSSDDLRGRISTTVSYFQSLTFGDYLGSAGKRLASFGDSGYVYVIGASTIFGLLFLWFFFASALPTDTASRRRSLFLLNLFLCINLMVSGNAVFSMKTAGPLWALIGYLGYRRRPWATLQRRSGRDVTAVPGSALHGV